MTEDLTTREMHILKRMNGGPVSDSFSLNNGDLYHLLSQNGVTTYTKNGAAISAEVFRAAEKVFDQESAQLEKTFGSDD